MNDDEVRAPAPHRWAADDIPDAQRPKLVFEYVRAIENRQSDVRLQMYRNAYLYTGEELHGISVNWQRSSGAVDLPRINIVQSVIETANSRIGSREPGLAVTTRGGDWGLRRKAQGLEAYASGTLEAVKFSPEWARAMGDGAALGTGVVRWFDDPKSSTHLGCARVFTPEIVVDQLAARTTSPRGIFHRRFVDVDELAAQYPDSEDAIWESCNKSTMSGYCDYIEYAPYTVPVIEAFHKGRRTGVYLDREGLDGILTQDPWPHEFFPIIEFRWMQALTGWYGIGIPEIVHFLQARVNRHAAYVKACQDRAVSPSVIVDEADADLTESTTNAVGQIIVSRGSKRPEFITPPQVPPEIYKDEERKIQQIYQVSGVSEFSTGGRSRPPTGLDSQPAMAEWLEYQEGRFAKQEKQYDRGFVLAAELAITMTKKLASDGKIKPKATWNMPRYGLIDVDWSDVDMERDQYRLKIKARSSVGDTPAGLRQRLEEERAAGRVADDLYRYFVQTLDVDGMYSLYDAAVNDIMNSVWINTDEDKEFKPPAEYMALELGCWIYQMEWNKADALGAPPAVLRRLSTWIELAEYLIDQGKSSGIGAPALGPAQVGGGSQAPQLAAPDTLALPGLSS
jgi:hypothetical protein